MNDKVFVEARFQIVAKIKGHKLADPQTVMVSHTMGKELDGAYSFEDFRKVFYACLEASIRAKAADTFIGRLKKETALKRTVGGTAWTVELGGSVDEMPLYLEESNLGDFKQFLNRKNPKGTRNVHHSQLGAMDFVNFFGQIYSRNMAIVTQLSKRCYGPGDELAEKVDDAAGEVMETLTENK